MGRKSAKVLDLAADLLGQAVGWRARRLWGKGGQPMLKIGDMAPDFRVSNHRGQTVSLVDLKGRYALLWFFPKADTPG